MWKLLDLCCGGGGASVGYARAGFEVVGVDNHEQPGYPFEFWKMNSLALTYEKLALFDVIHASPPCQQYSNATALARRRGKTYPDIFRAVKAMLIASGQPYVIENVVGSPARGIGLCGTMFGLGVFRHRIFESNLPLRLPDTHCSCSARSIDRLSYFTVVGNMARKDDSLRAMGIDWPMLKRQLTAAIPPAYTEFLGQQVISILDANDLAAAMNERREMRRSGLVQKPLW